MPALPGGLQKRCCWYVFLVSTTVLSCISWLFGPAEQPQLPIRPRTMPELRPSITARLADLPSISSQAWDDLSLIREVEAVRGTLDHVYSQMQESYGTQATVSCRTKSVASLADKVKKGLADKPEYSVQEVHDLAGIRLVFRDLKALYEVAADLEERYEVLRKKDYILVPKEDGYRSVHYNLFFENILIEVQLRTESMDRWATWSHDLLYKNSAIIENLVGTYEFERFHTYSKELSNYFYYLDIGRARPAPKAPLSLRILWDYAPGSIRAIMRSNGAPDYAPVHPIARIEEGK